MNSNHDTEGSWEFSAGEDDATTAELRRSIQRVEQLLTHLEYVGAPTVADTDQQTSAAERQRIHGEIGQLLKEFRKEAEYRIEQLRDEAHRAGLELHAIVDEAAPSMAPLVRTVHDGDRGHRATGMLMPPGRGLDEGSEIGRQERIADAAHALGDVAEMMAAAAASLISTSRSLIAALCLEIDGNDVDGSTTALRGPTALERADAR